MFPTSYPRNLIHSPHQPRCAPRQPNPSTPNVNDHLCVLLQLEPRQNSRLSGRQKKQTADKDSAIKRIEAARQRQEKGAKAREEQVTGKKPAGKRAGALS